MTEMLSATAIAARADIPDWRFLLGRIEATFRTGSFMQASTLVQLMAASGDTAGLYPQIDLRPPGLVRVSLGLTLADVELAATISARATDVSAVSEARAAARVEVAIDAIDIDAVRPFWKAVLGYEDEPPSRPGGQIVDIVDPLRIGPVFWFQQMDAPRPQRNRIHIDVTVPHDEAQDRVAAALAAGGTLVSDRYARSWWILADAEGNEACICTWQDRE